MNQRSTCNAENVKSVRYLLRALRYEPFSLFCLYSPFIINQIKYSFIDKKDNPPETNTSGLRLN